MSETIGQRLRRAREERHFSLEKASDSTRIRLHYLQALETDDYSLIPSAAQARGFLRNYAAFLELDLGEALAEVQRSRPEPAQEISGPLPAVDPAPDMLTASRIPEEQASGGTSPLIQRLRTAGSAFLARFQKPVDSSETDGAPLRTEEELKLEGPLREVVEAPSMPEAAADPRPEPVKVKRRTKKAETAAARPDPSPEKEPARVGTQTTLPAGQPVPALEAAPAEAETASGTSDPAEAQDAGEASDGGPPATLWSRLTSIFRLRFTPREPTSDESPQTDSDSEPEALVPLPGPLAETPEQIFMEIGSRLRKRRELLSLTVEEIERHIKVRAVFIKSLEEGAFDKLPSAVQTRGMLANYAAFMDLDTDALLLRFADAIQAGHRLRYPEKPAGTKSPMRISPSMPPLRSFIAGDLIFGVSIAVLLIAMAVWGVNRVFTTQAAEQAFLPTAPSISDVLATSQLPTDQQLVTLIPAVDTPFPAGNPLTPTVTLEPLTFDATITVQVTILVVERTFLRVVVDGDEVYNGRPLPGASFTYEAAESVEVLTGNGAALRITFNSRELGLMGNFGEVVNRIYTANGVITPTPAAPPTSTPSLTPTPSQTPSATPRTSPTPGG